MRVKVLGAGSIGNHLSHASRSLGWHVDICDIDPAALERTKTEIYPSRYGKWDDAIGTYLSADAPKGGYDLICIGTPPHVHLPLAIEALNEQPKAILIEKPVCGPDLKDADTLFRRARDQGVAIFVGYDHVVGKAAQDATASARAHGALPLTLDVEFREFWGGIFAAHPWLAGPWETYLGFSRLGGGASGEHSHAINLWQHFAHELGAGRVVEVQAMLQTVKDDKVDYDSLCLLNLKTENGLVGRCVQDVVTQPPRKWARMQFADGHVEWQCGREPGLDVVLHKSGNAEAVETAFRKTRPDDFIEELRHIERALANGDGASSSLSIQRGLETMLVVAAAHLSNEKRRSVTIDYAKGFVPEALALA